MSRLLASPRSRRRIVWSLPIVAAAAVFAALVAALPRGSGIPPEEPSSEQVLAEEPVPVAPVEREVPVTRSTRREVNAVLTSFVRHAVARQDPEVAWALATPALKAGTTLAQWRRGELPVYPFPARPEEATGWYVVESFENDLLLDLVMHARPDTKRGAIAYQVELKRLGTGRDRRWLVESFIPERIYPPVAETRNRQAAPRPPTATGARLSAYWFVVPGLLLSLIALVPLAASVVNWRRGVRAEKAYRRSLEEAEAD